MIKKTILIATGGTGGHIFRLTVWLITLLKKNYNIKFSSDKRGLKFFKNNQNLKIINIPSSPLVKKNILKFLFSLITIFYAVIKSFFFLFNRPSVVFEWVVILPSQFALQLFLKKINSLFMKII